MDYRKLYQFEANVRVVKQMAMLCQRLHCSHKRRSERLYSMRTVIEDMLDVERLDIWTEEMSHYERVDFFGTCYEMARWDEGSETHTLVKNRMWVIIDLCEMMMSKITKEMAAPVSVAEPMDLPAQILADIPF